ncbi:MAG: hypothetical protein H6Q90_5189 [Deltaproteobacteria bacterium]|nr:hypothetical protein [Deltaproteobacteria bacterium]
MPIPWLPCVIACMALSARSATANPTRPGTYLSTGLTAGFVIDPGGREGGVLGVREELVHTRPTEGDAVGALWYGISTGLSWRRPSGVRWDVGPVIGNAIILVGLGYSVARLDSGTHQGLYGEALVGARYGGFYARYALAFDGRKTAELGFWAQLPIRIGD